MVVRLKPLLLWGLAAGAGLLTISLAVQGVLSQQRPEKLGLVDGRLRPCPADSRNCVCSEAGSPRHVQPFALAVDNDKALESIASVVTSTPRAEVVTKTDDYLHAEYTSLIFRFVDDVELRLDPAERLVHVRSASRAGKGDLGVNRKRVEQLRERLRSAGIVR